MGLPFALAVGSITFLLGVIWGGPLIELLRRLGIGKQIRAELGRIELTRRIDELVRELLPHHTT